MTNHSPIEDRGLNLILQDHTDRIGEMEGSFRDILPKLGETSQDINNISVQLDKIDATLNKASDHFRAKMDTVETNMSTFNSKFLILESKIASLEDTRTTHKANKRGLIVWASTVATGVIVAVFVYFLRLR